MDTKKSNQYWINDRNFTKQEDLSTADHTSDIQLISVSDKMFIYRQGNRFHRLSIENLSGGVARVAIQGELYEGKKMTMKDELRQKLSIASEDSSTSKDIKSPMPGTVLRLLKQAGDQVEKGETVLIVEAMKMENEIKSPMTGFVSAMKVEAGQAISNRQFLFSVSLDETKH